MGLTAYATVCNNLCTGQTKGKTMATIYQVRKALEEIGATFDKQQGRFIYEDVELLAPEGKVWASNLCSVLCFQVEEDIRKSDLWDLVLDDIKDGVIDESEV
jgi:hypothetical protein